MKIKIISIIGVVFLALVLTVSFINKSNTNYLYWEQLSNKQKEAVLNDPHILKYAADLYKNQNYNHLDLPACLEFLDSVSNTRNEKLFSLYYFLFIKITNVADGVLAEGVSSCGIELLKNHSEYIINHFRTGKNGKTEMEIFESFVYYEIYVTNNDQT
jgi:hypothetical protein